MCGKRLLRVFCLIGLMTCAACSSRPKDASETETTLTLFPVQEENNEAEMNTPETQVLMELTESRNTAVALSYHATGSVLYWDFGQTGEFRDRCLSFVKTVNGLTGYRIVYATSEKQDEAGYCEWAAGIKGIPEVTIEIGTVAAPLPISEFAGVWERNKEVPVAVACQVLVDREESRE